MEIKFPATVFQIRSLYVPTKDRSPLQGNFWESLVFRLHSEIGQIHLSINPPGETRGIHVNSASFLFKTRGDLAEFTWFVRWESCDQCDQHNSWVQKITLFNHLNRKHSWHLQISQLLLKGYKQWISLHLCIQYTSVS